MPKERRKVRHQQEAEDGEERKFPLRNEQSPVDGGAVIHSLPFSLPRKLLPWAVSVEISLATRKQFSVTVHRHCKMSD
jgi:hypothetical protein